MRVDAGVRSFLYVCIPHESVFIVRQRENHRESTKTAGRRLESHWKNRRKQQENHQGYRRNTGNTGGTPGIQVERREYRRNGGSNRRTYGENH